MSDRSSRSDAVLVPTGRQMKSYAVIRSLARRGIRTVVASEHGTIPQFSSRYCSERVRLSAPPGDVTAYRDALMEIAARPDVRTIVPIREPDAFVLAKYRDEFAEHVSLVVPDLPTLRRAHDRLELAQAAEAAGVPCADTRPLSDVGTLEEDAVVKSRYNLLAGEYVDGYPADAVEEVKDVRYLQPGERPDVRAVSETMNHEPIVQEHVPWEDKWLYGGLWRHGEPAATFQHREVRGSSWVGGGGVYRVSDHSERVESIAHDLLEELEWHGLACIEYVRDADTGEWKFLELNPRVWQSLPAAVRAGADFPHYYWQCATGAADEVDPDYELGVGCHQLYGELGHLLSLRHDDSPLAERPSVAGTLWEVATTCLAQPRFDYLRLDDPGFFLGAVRQALASGDGDGREFHSGASQQPASTDGGTREQ